MNYTAPPIVIIVAMESERTHLVRAISNWVHLSMHHWPTMITNYQEVPLVAVRCGIGMVAAAAATEAAISIWKPQCIMNFGCAGAHLREVLPGDVVIGTELVSHGRMRISATEGIVPMDVPFHVVGEPEPRTRLQADASLVQMAEQAASKLELEAWPKAFHLRAHPDDGAVRVHTGVVASADVWMQDPAWLDAMHERTGSLCEDMEAAAIAQIATAHNVPFLTVKDISNNEFHAVSVFDETTSVLPLDEVGKRAAAVTVETIDRLIAANAG